MDKKVANNIIVGIFVALGFVGFVFVLFNMSGGSFFTSGVTLYAKFPQVKGLHEGSEVSLSGLRVGVVKDIVVDTNGDKELTIELSVIRKYAKTLHQDSTASIRTQGVLGDRYVELTIGSPTSPPLKHGDFIKSVEEPDLFAKSGNLVSGISRYFEPGGDLDALLHNLNRVAENVADVTSEIHSEKSLLHELIYGRNGANLDKSTEHVESILGKIDRGDGTIGALINDPTVYEDIKYLLGGAKRSSILKYFMNQFIDSGRKDNQQSNK